MASYSDYKSTDSGLIAKVVTDTERFVSVKKHTNELDYLRDSNREKGRDLYKTKDIKIKKIVYKFAK